MIQHLELHRWRAFESLDVEFSDGTTFVVAPNGVGKTSLTLGLTWAVFGDAAGLSPAQHIRIGHESAAVTVTILTDAHEIQIHRTVNTNGRQKNEYRIDGDAVDEATADAALRGLYGAPTTIAARLAVIDSAGSKPLDIQDHLFHAFGVSDLLAAATEADRLHKDAVKARKALRSESRQTLDNREQLDERAARLRDEIERRRTARQDLTNRIQAANAKLRLAEAWKNYDDAAEEREIAIRRAIEASPEPVGNLEELQALASAQLERIQIEQQRASATLDSAKTQRAAAMSALQLLEGQHPACPTCDRPFDHGELDAALVAQRQSAAAADQLAETATREIDALDASLTEAAALSTRLDELAKPLTSPETPRPEEDLRAQLSAAEEALRAHDEDTGRLSGELAEIEERLGDDSAVRPAHESELSAWRREATTQALTSSLHASADRLANEQIVPLSDQVRWRWKALFGDDGLQLRADGSIARQVGDRELSWEQLSGGERIWARLVAGLLVLQASTKLPFAWIDEPLEHLDPRARRIVAADLANAPSHGGPRQLIVTTYEHAIARQIAHDVPGVSMLVVNHSPSER